VATETNADETGGRGGLRGFLSELATDRKRLGAYIGDPEVSMREAGLTEEEQQLLKSGNLAQINARLVAEQAGGKAAPVAVVVIDGEQLQKAYTQGLGGAVAGATAYQYLRLTPLGSYGAPYPGPWVAPWAVPWVSPWGMAPWGTTPWAGVPWLSSPWAGGTWMAAPPWSAAQMWPQMPPQVQAATLAGAYAPGPAHEVREGRETPPTPLQAAPPEAATLAPTHIVPLVPQVATLAPTHIVPLVPQVATLAPTHIAPVVPPQWTLAPTYAPMYWARPWYSWW